MHRGTGAGRIGHVICEDGRVEGALGAGVPDGGACATPRWPRSRREASTTASSRAGAARRASSSRCFRASRGWSIFGGVHIAVALVPLARALGYRTIVADGRPAFLTPRALPRRRRADPGLARGGVRADRPRRLVLRLHPVPRSQVRRAGAARSRSARRRATSARSARGRRRRPAASGSRRRDSTTRDDRPGARADRARPRRAPARRDGAGDSGGDDGGALRRRRLRAPRLTE